jgi:hypothetical protein
MKALYDKEALRRFPRTPPHESIDRKPTHKLLYTRTLSNPQSIAPSPFANTKALNLNLPQTPRQSHRDL